MKACCWCEAGDEVDIRKLLFELRIVFMCSTGANVQCPVKTSGLLAQRRLNRTFSHPFVSST